MSPCPVMTDPLPQSFVDLLGDQVELHPWTTDPESDTLRRCRGIICYSHPAVDGPLLDAMPELRVVSNHGVGVDHIDVAAAVSRGIPVGNTPGCLDASTADMTLALLLAAARNVRIGDRYARSPEFVHYDPSILIGHEVTGSTLGIVGLGRIGREVARRAAAFNMRLLYHNRRPDPEAEAALGVEYCSLEELLRQSDFVSLNCPLTEETTGLISGPQLKLMRSSALLINMARGPVVDHAALVEALTSGTIAGAALDVTDPEPLPRDHPLLSLENVLITPHLGSASDRTRRRMMEMTAENLQAGLSGRALPWQVMTN
ncbi:MAG: D-glycerate dehydrogenase [Planctomycetaceae bacterium]|nr:D-glycerate dehydrogenase [Planctomycetaceae bacterium]